MLRTPAPTSLYDSTHEQSTAQSHLKLSYFNTEPGLLPRPSPPLLEAAQTRRFFSAFPLHKASPKLSSLTFLQDPSTLHLPGQPGHPFFNCFLTLSPTFTLALLPITPLMASVCSYKCQLDQVNPCHTEDRAQCCTWPPRTPAGWPLPPSPHSLPSYPLALHWPSCLRTWLSQDLCISGSITRMAPACQPSLSLNVTPLRLFPDPTMGSGQKGTHLMLPRFTVLTAITTSWLCVC